MIEHYNAFISYKHEPEDIKIAKTIQKSLERYHIPKKLRDSTGVDKIDRIFRDTDELPLTSDLTETIYDALDKSDYLIVICSTKTKESQWVEREIEYFISKHSRKEVLTILVDGEPSEVVPEILSYEEETVTDEEGNEKTVRKPLEPLSCDYRMPVKEAEKTELPRLVSTLIGCDYDELVDRQKAYKTRSLIHKLAVAIVIISLFVLLLFYGIIRIQYSYGISLASKSKILANESLEQLEEGQRVLALQLALAALPEEGEVGMPVTSEAVRAITDATGAYNSNKEGEFLNDYVYEMPSMIGDFVVNDSMSRLAAVDLTGSVCLWDTEKHEQIFFHEPLNESVWHSILFINDRTLIVWTPEYIEAYNAQNGNLLWKNSYDSFSVIESDSEADNVYLVDSENTIHILSAETGKESAAVTIKDFDYNIEETASYMELSPDEKQIAFFVHSDKDDVGIYTLYVFSFDTEKMEAYKEITNPSIIYWYDSTRLLINETIHQGENSIVYYSRDGIYKHDISIYCIDTKKKDVLWQNSISPYADSYECGFLPSEDGNAVSFFSGEIIVTYNVDTGKELDLYRFNGSISTVYDIRDLGMPQCITYHGYLCGPDSDDDSGVMYNQKMFPDKIDSATLRKNCVFVLPEDSNEVLSYTDSLYDEDYNVVCEESDGEEIYSDMTVYGDDIVFLSVKNHIHYLKVVTTEDKKIYTLNIEGLYENVHDVKGVYNGNIYFMYNDEENNHLREINILSGKDRDIILDEADMSAIFYSTLEDGYLCYIKQAEDHIQVKTLNLDDWSVEDAQVFDLFDEEGFPEMTPYFSPDDEIIYYSGEKDYIIKTDTEKIINVSLPEDWYGTEKVSNILNNSILITDENRVLKVNMDGKVKLEISKPGYKPLYIYQYDGIDVDNILVFYPGILCRYDISTGKNEKTTNLSMAYYDSPISIDEPDDYSLFVKNDSMQLCIIDTENWYETAVVNSYGGCDSDKNIYTYSFGMERGKSKMGYYKYYEVDDLIEKAEKMLGGKELSDKKKAYYGLDD